MRPISRNQETHAFKFAHPATGGVWHNAIEDGGVGNRWIRHNLWAPIILCWSASTWLRALWNHDWTRLPSSKASCAQIHPLREGQGVRFRVFELDRGCTTPMFSALRDPKHDNVGFHDQLRGVRCRFRVFRAWPLPNSPTMHNPSVFDGHDTVQTSVNPPLAGFGNRQDT